MSHPATLPAHASVTVTDDLLDAVARRIEQATYGQVGALSVTRLDGSVVIEGHSRTYHLRQLALQAALDALDGAVPLIDLIAVH